MYILDDVSACDLFCCGILILNLPHIFLSVSFAQIFVSHCADLIFVHINGRKFRGRQVNSSQVMTVTQFDEHLSQQIIYFYT